MPREGGSARRLSTTTSAYDGLMGVAVGRDVSFTSLESGASDIWIMAANGGRRRQLVGKGINADPSFSPDGRSVVFASGPTAGGNSRRRRHPL